MKKISFCLLFILVYILGYDTYFYFNNFSNEIFFVGWYFVFALVILVCFFYYTFILKMRGNETSHWEELIKILVFIIFFSGILHMGSYTYGKKICSIIVMVIIFFSVWTESFFKERKKNFFKKTEL